MSSTQRILPAQLRMESFRGMRLTMVGAGYVGLVTGACLSELGHHVTCVDVNTDCIKKLKAGEMPIYEPGLSDMVKRGVDGGRLRFTSNIGRGVDGADAVFIAVGTPPGERGRPDLSFVHAAAYQIAESLTGPCVIVNKSTVPVGTAESMQQTLGKLHLKHPVEVASNPEFLREGSAILDFMYPDRIVCGAKSDWGHEVLAQIYQPLLHRNTPVLFTDWYSSELSKCAANAFLATKVAFINEIANLCERSGADIGDVALSIGMDTRIGSKFLSPGPGYGGSCLRKDAMALIHTGQDLDYLSTIVEATVTSNDNRRVMMAKKVVEACFGSVRGKTIAVLGLTFKANTDDMRDSPSLVIVPYLQKRGASIKAFDPKARRQAEKLLSGVTFTEDSYAAVEDADAVVVITDWDEFRDLDLELVRSLVKTPVFIDLRNVYEPSVMCELGFRYISIGRPSVG